MAGERLSDALEALLIFLARVESMGLRCVVVGSVASSIHGEPRMTQDSDVVVAMQPRDLPALLSALRPDFHVPADTAAQAVAARSSFGTLYTPTMQKSDRGARAGAVTAGSLSA